MSPEPKTFTEVAIAQAKRDHRIAVFETIGCALAALRRLDQCWYDTDIHDTLAQVRSTLSVTQSKVKERIDASAVRNTP
jgi:hypothetical protein